jgi:hypothetical protein
VSRTTARLSHSSSKALQLTPTAAAIINTCSSMSRTRMPFDERTAWRAAA